VIVVDVKDKQTMSAISKIVADTRDSYIEIPLLRLHPCQRADKKGDYRTASIPKSNGRQRKTDLTFCKLKT
jgi:hypothetical protein